MHTSKESRVNLSQKNRHATGPSDFKHKDEYGDGENVDNPYHQAVEEM